MIVSSNPNSGGNAIAMTTGSEVESAATADIVVAASAVALDCCTHHGAVVHMVFKNEPSAVTPATRADQRATLTGVGVGFAIYT